MFVRIGLTALLLAGCITCLALVTGQHSGDTHDQDRTPPGKLLAQQAAGGSIIQ